MSLPARPIIGTVSGWSVAANQTRFFVVGFPRSGTTLLSVLLDRHSRLCVPPETAFFDEVAPRLRRPSEAALSRALGSWSRLSELTLEPEAIRKRLPENWQPGDVLAAILDLYALRRGKTRCGEKTPQHLRHVPTILQLFKNARIVCLLRDGRDAALSLTAMPWGPGLRSAAGLWRQYVQLMEEYERRYPAQFRVLRYEDLLGDPVRQLSIVMDDLGESIEPAQLSTNTPSHVVLPRSMPWKGDALGPIDRSRIASRRLGAAASELVRLERWLGADLRRCGYD